MARGSTRRSYVRDGRGRFASTGTTSTKAKPAAKRAQRGTSRLTRDNSGKITGVGKNGATARGGRLRTAAGNQRGAVLDRMKKRQSPSGAIRATDVGKAKVSNYMSKMVQKNQARYDKAAIARGNFPVAENATRRLLAAQSRIAKQDRAKPAAKPAKPAKTPRAGKAKGPSKGERVIARIQANMARASVESRSKKEERKLARTAAVARMAVGRVSLLGVGKRDPSQQYTKAEMLPQLNKSLSRPTPKRERKSTLKPDFSRGARGLAQGAAMKARAAARKEGKLAGSRAPKQIRSGRPAGTVRRPADYVRKAVAITKAATVARRPAKTRQDKAAQATRLASRAAARSQSPKLSKAAALRSEKLSAKLKARAKQLSQRPTLSRAQRDKAARARKDYGVKSTGTKGKKGAATPSGVVPSGRTVYRGRAQAIRAQRARTNALGKATASKRGFNQTTAANQRARIAGRSRDVSMFADSAPRTVISRPRIAQLSLSGRVERVGAGRFRTVGERLGGGSIRRPRSKPGPLRGSKAWKRQLEQAIKANGGKDVAAFRF
jgi:hypothetical protein